jgi:PAS domain S-box-containing protein
VALAYLVTGRPLGATLLASGIAAVIALVCRQLLALLDSMSFGSEQTARFAALVRRSSDLTTIVSADGTIVYQSPSSLRLLGLQPAQLEGSSFHELVHADDAPGFLRTFGQAMGQPGSEMTGEWRLSLGHAAGDELLREVAQRLHGVVRASDTVARVGGDEFAIVLDGRAAGSDTEETAERILAVFNDPFVVDGEERFTRASVGIAVSDSETVDAATLLHQADVAMYAAKASGKGRRETYKHGMREQVLDHIQLMADMRHAVERDELAIVYQPIVELSTGAMTSVEALMRWQHPTRGLLNPDKFIPAAESSGLIVPMGRWLLRQACRDLRSWQDLGGPPLRLNVNLSGRQLDDPGLLLDVATALSDSKLDPALLTLEITESVLLRDFEAAKETLTRLKMHGVELSIDDLGTGYSSLSYLRQLPVDEIKIDRSFISAMTDSRESASLVRTIMRLAEDFHLTTVAEGVETADQLDELRAADCESVQGFLFASPLTAHQLQCRLRDGTLAWPASPSRTALAKTG